jgi:kynureninase
MPNDYDNRGAQEFGYEGEPDIIRLMTLDLYLYYSDLFSEAVAEVEQEIEEAEQEKINA